MKRLSQLNQEYRDRYETGNWMDDAISTGFNTLDNYIRGWVSGHLVVLAGRPSMGKTSFAVSSMVQASRKGHRSCFFSIESSDWEIFRKIYDHTQGKDLDSLDIHVDDRGLVTLEDIQESLVSLDPRLVLVDYLQLITSEARATRNEEVGKISRGLKRIAKERGCTVIALSQLSRATERREDSRPQLSDLRDSGSIEQDADIVLMMYRPDMYREFPTGDSEVELLIRKNRDEGTLGFLKMEYSKANESFKVI